MIGAGTRFFRSDDGAIWTQVSKVLDLTPPGMTRGSSEKTYLESLTNSKSYEPGMIDPGEMEATLEFDKTDTAQIALKADFDTKANFHYKVVYPDNTFHSFMGHLTDWGMEVPKEETVSRKVKIKLSTVIAEGTEA
tara:strand:+ start:150 stop:557 length:408 start_codon:yes stop_codon:yes gene_type:complete